MIAGLPWRLANPRALDARDQAAREPILRT
jgi:hypothetical protein